MLPKSHSFVARTFFEFFMTLLGMKRVHFGEPACPSMDHDFKISNSIVSSSQPETSLGACFTKSDAKHLFLSLRNKIYSSQSTKGPLLR
jgi:hypothetical protein